MRVTNREYEAEKNCRRKIFVWRMSHTKLGIDLVREYRALVRKDEEAGMTRKEQKAIGSEKQCQ